MRAFSTILTPKILRWLFRMCKPLFFKGTDIKDLEVREAAPSAPAFEDPAIVQAKSASAPPPPPSMPQQQQQQPQQPALMTPTAPSLTSGTPAPPPGVASIPIQAQQSQQYVPQGSNDRGHQQSHQQQQRRRGGGGGRGQSRGPRTLAGTGSHLLNMKTRDSVGDVKLDDSVNFDFASMNDKFDKAGEFAKLSLETNNEAEQEVEEDAEEDLGGYSKSSFFDTISCDITDREHGKRSGLYGQRERDLNKETFGATGLNHGNSRYRLTAAVEMDVAAEVDVVVVAGVGMDAVEEVDTISSKAKASRNVSSSSSPTLTAATQEPQVVTPTMVTKAIRRLRTRLRDSKLR
eukprot:CAMPEP_0171553358 /NCGR_PEP_ID=MMETSP0960-20121227/8874_1 /TAXON_ID=87120 /ORGANISM="Aurantiochytrium limacinum, Strain ATCCMYA-1381" /LENGTH=346 /DNA_ID=CAMNT_0012102993 /DNA_START=37 /DNA_END=1077 /DNA_ORIENTATION=-